MPDLHIRILHSIASGFGPLVSFLNVLPDMQSSGIISCSTGFLLASMMVALQCSLQGLSDQENRI